MAKKAGGEVTIPLPAPSKAGGVPPVPAAPAPAGPAVVAGQPGDLNLQGDSGTPVPEGTAVQNEVDNTKAMVQQLQKNVDIAINKARNQVATNPDLADQTVRQQIDDVRATNEPTPEEKDAMLRRLEAVRKDIGERKLEFEHRRQQMLADEAAKREREMALESMQRDERKISDLYQRMDYLMAESRHNEAEKAAELANDIAKKVPLPNAQPIATASINWTRFEAPGTTF